MRQLSCRDVWDRDGGTICLYILQLWDISDWDRHGSHGSMFDLQQRDVRVCHGAGTVYCLQRRGLQFWCRGKRVQHLLRRDLQLCNWEDPLLILCCWGVQCRHWR